MKYKALLVDPPWSFKVYSDAGKDRSAEQHYKTMSLGDIARLNVPALCDDDCVLFLWAIDPLLNRAFDLMAAWEFEYKTVAFYWVKQNLKSEGFFTGLGYWTRANCEQVLLGTRGKPKRLAKDVKRLIVAPRREHSRKPDEVAASIERLVEGPYLEMFARERRPGWDVFGNETDKFTKLDCATTNPVIPRFNTP
jgi:N6-adenosine-specific RNA methylase IME4